LCRGFAAIFLVTQAARRYCPAGDKFGLRSLKPFWKTILHLPRGLRVVIIPLMKSWSLAIFLTASLTVAGCVERDLHINSQPEGALVRVSHVELGRTPVTTPFLWHGDYEITLELDGYKTINTHASIMPKWYDVPPLDLLSELAPWTYYDRRELGFKMEKLVPPTDAELIERAREMQKKNLEPVEQPPR